MLPDFIKKLAELSDGIRKKAAAVKQASTSVAAVGVLSSEDGDLAMIAAANEYGTSTIPARSFMRIGTRDEKIREVINSEAEAYYSGDRTLEQILNRIGAVAAASIQETIASNIPPPNAESTISAKGSSRTLIDSGRLRRSITWEVRHK